MQSQTPITQPIMNIEDINVPNTATESTIETQLDPELEAMLREEGAKLLAELTGIDNPHNLFASLDSNIPAEEINIPADIIEKEAA